MQHTTHFENNSALLNLIAAIDDHAGAVDPEFDNDIDDLERQFAELRLAHASDLN